MRFWNGVLGLYPDVLGPGEKPLPYIQCINDQWEVVRKFDWLDYIDGGWDEGINCSSFRNSTLLKKVNSQIDRLSQAEKKDYHCSLEKEKIKSLRKKYGKYSDHLLNPSGHTVLTGNLQPKVLLDKFWKMQKQNSKPDWKINLFDLIENRIKELQQTSENQD